MIIIMCNACPALFLCHMLQPANYPPSLPPSLPCPSCRGGAKDVNVDERIAVSHQVMAAPVDETCRLAYPSLYPLHDPSGAWGLEDGEGLVGLPPTVPLTLPMLLDGGVYLLDNGRIFILWVGRCVSPQWCQEVCVGGALRQPIVVPRGARCVCVCVGPGVMTRGRAVDLA